ncbi:hypothetical protein [Falsirhodobacter sp. 1013]
MTHRPPEKPDTDLTEVLRQVLSGLAPTHGYSLLIDRLERRS